MTLQVPRVILITLEENFPLSSPPFPYTLAKPQERSFFCVCKKSRPKEVEHKALSSLSVSGYPSGCGHPEDST